MIYVGISTFHLADWSVLVTPTKLSLTWLTVNHYSNNLTWLEKLSGFLVTLSHTKMWFEVHFILRGKYLCLSTLLIRNIELVCCYQNWHSCTPFCYFIYQVICLRKLFHCFTWCWRVHSPASHFGHESFRGTYVFLPALPGEISAKRASPTRRTVFLPYKHLIKHITAVSINHYGPKCNLITFYLGLFTLSIYPK